MVRLFNCFFLIISIVLLLRVLLKNHNINEKEKNSDYFQIDNLAYKILLITIIIIGVLVRLWQFGVIPSGFNQDGAMAAVDGLALAKYGTNRFGTWLPAHLYAWGYSQMSSLLPYLIALFIKIFNFSPIVVRLPQLLVSIMGGIFFYLFMKDIFGKKIGLLAAFFVAINPWHFMQSRWTLEANLLPHFFMGGLYFLNKGITQKKKYIYISMIFFGLSMYCYGIAIYTIPFFLILTAVFYYVKKQINIKEILISICIYLLISWPFILTMMVNFFKWDTIKLPFVTIQYFSDSVRSNDILFFSKNIGKQFCINLGSLINTTILQRKDLPWNDITGFGTMYYFTIPFVIIGIISLSKVELKENKYLIFLALLTGIWTGLTTNYVNVNRMNIIYYTIMMFAVIGIYQVMTKIKYAKLLIPMMYIIIFIFMINTYFTTYSKEIGKYFYEGFGDALNKAESAGTSKIYITADAQGVGYVATSEILTMFYNKMDAKYFQGETNINNGKEYLLYKDRYHYLSITPDVINATKDDDVAYVIMNSDKQYFSDDYKIIDYGNFCAVTKK